jgi:N-methylhydantoinase B
MRLLADEAVLTLLGDRHKFAPYGVFGGGEAAVGRSVVISGNEEVDLGSKEVAVLKRDDVVSLRTSGAGGYGSAAERDPALVERDLADGYVTPEGARMAYGR